MSAEESRSTAESDTTDVAPEPPFMLPYLAYFFVPLPEPLGLPHGWILRIHEPTPAHWWHHEDSPVPPLVHTAGSLLFHRVETATPERTWPTVLFDVATACLPDENRTASPTNPRYEYPPTQSTVVEIAVGFDPDLGEDSSGSADGSHFDRAVSDAFDQGIAWIREMQRAYYAIRRLPSKLVTRESMPFVIPLGIRRLDDENGESLTFHASLSMYFLNLNVVARDVDLEEPEQEALKTALREQAGDGVFTSYLNFQREARVALARDGAYATAVLFTATACEVLLDDLLAHMMWQEGQRPEEAVKEFSGFLMTRVKKRYHHRLGGSWSVDAPGQIRDWAVDVAALRNRVVHGGYEPTSLETQAAVNAAEKLQNYLSDLVVVKSSTYPRTALVLPGENGLRRRGQWSQRFDELKNDPTEVPWTETFARWRLAMQRARPDSPLATKPSATESHVLLTISPSGATRWIIHDLSAGLAAIVDQSLVLGLSSDRVVSLDQYVETAMQVEFVEVQSVYVAGATVAQPVEDAWLPEYRLVPMAGVMINGLDLDPL